MSADLTENARSRTELDHSTIAGATVTNDNESCRRCGDRRRDHCNGDGQPLQGRRASRFTGYGFCDRQHLSGGTAGSLQWCGCLGFEQR